MLENKGRGPEVKSKRLLVLCRKCTWLMVWHRGMAANTRRWAASTSKGSLRSKDGRWSGVDDFLVAWRLAGLGKAWPPRGRARHFLGMEATLEALWGHLSLDSWRPLLAPTGDLA